MFVYQAMSTYVVAITPDESAAAAARDLIERDITGLPVIDEDGHVLGVVTEIDLLRAARTGVDLSQVTVAAVMDGRPLFVGPEMDLTTAIDLMEEWQVRRLPVCAGSRLVGIVSRRDILVTLVDSGRQAAIPVR
ncbi:MAG: CBS domain-containing protein [Dehalococcoidia bacterium]